MTTRKRQTKTQTTAVDAADGSRPSLASTHTGCARCRTLLRQLRAWWENYETFDGKRYPKKVHVRAFIVRLHEEADAMGISFEEHHAAVRARCVMTTRSAIYSSVRASESGPDRDRELARELAGAASERVVQTSRDGRGRIVKRQLPGDTYKSWRVDIFGDFGWERQPAVWDFLRNARSELRSKTDGYLPAPWDLLTNSRTDAKMPRRVRRPPTSKRSESGR